MSLNWQSLDGEAKVLMERLTDNVGQLVYGWREKVEYMVPIRYHDKGQCTFATRMKNGDICNCPIKNEKRARHIQVDCLLDQLKEFAKSKDVDRNPKAARQAPRVKKVKFMPELNGFFTLDEITCDAYMLIDRAYEMADLDRTISSRPLSEVLGGLVIQMGQIVEARPDIVRDMVKATGKWVASARRTLNLTVADAMFEGVVCENCGGALSIAWDNSSEVKCIGSPSAASCGHTYPMSEWVALYEKGKANGSQAGSQGDTRRDKDPSGRG